MSDNRTDGCTPEACAGCTGCGGEIEKITLRVEWQHNGSSAEMIREISDMMDTFAHEFAVSGVELIFINNTFSKDIPVNSSEFLINGRKLKDLIPDTDIPSPITKELLRKGIFQALLQNI